MKKLTAWVLALAGVLGLAGCFGPGAGTNPYQGLTTEEISAATVQLQPPDKTLLVEELDQLVALLQELVIYEEDSSYTEYAGQAVTVQLTMSDGSQTSVTEYNPFLIIDGVGYRTEYEPCEALNRYANELLNSEDAVVVLEQPPVLTVVSDETAMTALLGTYSWQRKNADGSVTSVETDSPHPLDCEELLSPPLETAEATAALRFTEEPDEIVSVQCWRDSHWSDTSAAGEDVAYSGTAIDLRSGGYVYEIVARWDSDSGYGGTARYSFYITAEQDS